VPSSSPRPGAGRHRSNHRLKFSLRITKEHLLEVANDEVFAWNDVEVTASDGEEFLECPSLPRVDSGSIVTVDGRLCRGRVEHRFTGRVCGVELDAKEGSASQGFEPCVATPR
jgi:hypothetical protein